MGFEAARLALRAAADAPRPDMVWFSTVAPAYVDKTNATAIHAALRLDDDVAALDLGGAQRSAVGALRIALLAGPDHGARRRVRHAHRPARRRRRGRGRRRCGRAARRRRHAAPLLAEHIGFGVDHRGVPRPLAGARRRPLEGVGGALRRDEVRRRWASGPGTRRSSRPSSRPATSIASSSRAPTRARRASLANRLGVAKEALVDDLGATVGNTGAAHPALLLAADARAPAGTPGQVIALVVLADGADVLLFRTTDAHRRRTGPRAAVADQVAAGRAGALRQVPRVAGHAPRRAAPPPRARTRVGVGVGPARGVEVRLRGPARSRHRRAAAAAAAQRARARPPWPTCPARSPPTPSTGSRTPRARRSCSPSSTSTAAAGSRSSSPTCAEADVQVGGRVEMTFRRLFTADGIHNYFWKARPLGSGRQDDRTVGELDAFARDQGPGRDRRRRLHAVRRALGPRRRRPHGAGRGRGARVGRGREGRDRRLLAGHGA